MQNLHESLFFWVSALLWALVTVFLFVSESGKTSLHTLFLLLFFKVDLVIQCPLFFYLSSEVNLSRSFKKPCNSDGHYSEFQINFWSVHALYYQVIPPKVMNCLYIYSDYSLWPLFEFHIFLYRKFNTFLAKLIPGYFIVWLFLWKVPCFCLYFLASWLMLWSRSSQCGPWTTGDPQDLLGSVRSKLFS